VPLLDSAFTRRRFLQAGAGLAAGLSGCSSRFPTPEEGPFTVLLRGPLDDGGFNSSLLQALTRVEAARGIPVHVNTVSSPDAEAATAALREAARSDATMIFAAGSQLAWPIQRVAWEFPQQRFTLLQGELIRPNLGAYVLNEEEPAWLAGFLAGRLSARHAVALVSDTAGTRRRRIEGAFRAGALRADGETAVLAEADDGDQAAAVARVAGRADVVYGALDAAPQAAVAACRAGGLRFIGCMRDWMSLDPETVVASALIDPGQLFATATQDIIDAVWRGDLVRSYGLRYPRMLGFAVGAPVPAALAEQIRSAALDLTSRRVALPPTPG
jgi:basic membrane protein A